MMKRAKIVCTLGPACGEYDVLKRVAQAGMDVARLNFSHGDYSSHGRHLENVRRLEKELKRPFGTIIDTKGPEIRTRGLKGHAPVLLESGSYLILTVNDLEKDVEALTKTEENENVTALQQFTDGLNKNEDTFVNTGGVGHTT